MTTFRPLDPDEPIGVVALSGPVDPVRLERGLTALRSWGHPIATAANLRRRHGYLAGTDEDRLAGLNELLDAGVRTFIAARGGVGLTRLLDRLPWAKLVESGARFVGFSDLTALINPLADTTVQVHGPMVAAGLDRPANANRLRGLLMGDGVGTRLYAFGDGRVLRHGTAIGRLLGGNLSLLVSLMGTPWEVDLKGAVLALEETGEPPYRLDRMLSQLAYSRGFSRLTGLISGRLFACRPRDEALGAWNERLLAIAPVGVPVVTELPFGHGAHHRAFPIGADVVVDTGRGEVLWRA